VAYDPRTVIGPKTATTINTLGVWSTTTGTEQRQGAPGTITGTQTTPTTADGAALSAYTRSGFTADYIMNWGIGSPAGSIYTTDGVRGINVVNSLSTGINHNGVGGYVLNNNPSGSGGGGSLGDGVGVYGEVIAAVNDAHVWGMAAIAADIIPEGSPVLNAATGKVLYGAEFDLNVSSPNTTGSMLMLGGTSWMGAPTTLGINGLAINRLWGPGGPGTGQALLANGILLADGLAETGIVIGAGADTGTSINGMRTVFSFRDSAGTVKNLTLTAMAAGTGGILTLGGNGTDNDFAVIDGSINIETGQMFSIGNRETVTANATPNLSIGSDVSYANIFIGNTTAKVQSNGPFRHAVLTVGTLPAAAAGNTFDEYIVTDATAGIIGDTVAGGGSTWTQVISNGTAWKII
jgi:hypothetical protein